MLDLIEVFKYYYYVNKFLLYTRHENADGIHWKSETGRVVFTYSKSTEEWFNTECNNALVLGIPNIEECFQYEKLKPKNSQLRLVSRGQSLKTGEEMIELQAYNTPRGIWEKLPLQVKFDYRFSGTLKDILENLHNV